ncbi:MATE family efflux transporter [Porphyromonas pogonae]|uniref:MATE family efflux transporter n=1 Tax=Porphyromonas pogonae TaxID=867595 RepID=UPI002E787A96|nr:MATE family efflux transporter [Porphyromonas pogonae]
MRKPKDLTHGNIRGLLMKLSLPIMGTSFIQMAYSFTDMAWLGRIGSKSVAAVGVVSVLVWLANSISSINKTGSEVTVGHALGRDDISEASQYASHNITMSLIISLLLAAIYYFFGRNILQIYELALDVESVAINYLRIIIFGLPFVFMSNTFSGIYNASGISSVPFKIMSTGLVMNIILDPLLIFGFKMGAVGAAWATLICQLVVFFYFLFHYKRKDRLYAGLKLFVPLQKSFSEKILKIGLPVAILNSLFVFVNMYMGRLVSKIGGHVGVATLTTGGQLEAITWNTSQGVTTALGAIVAQNYTAKKAHRIFKAYKEALNFTFIFGIIGTILFVFFGQEVFSIIVPDPETYRVGGEYLKIDGYSQLLMMLEITTQGVLYGTGRTMPPAIISVVGNYLRIPLAWLLLSWGWGLPSIWWAISITSMLKGIVAYVYYRSVKRKIAARCA